MPTPRSKGGNGGGSPSEVPQCIKCYKKLVVKLAGTYNFFGCGKNGQMMSHGQNQRNKGNQEQSSGVIFDFHKNNRYYGFKSRGNKEGTSDIVTGMLQVFSINIYAFLDSSANLSYVTPLVSMKFDVLPYVFVEPFSVSTQVGDSVVAKIVCRSCPLLLSNRVTLVDLEELYMLDFDVIFVIDWLHVYLL